MSCCLRWSGCHLNGIRRMTHSFAAHLPQLGYVNQRVMVTRLRRLQRSNLDGRAAAIRVALKRSHLQDNCRGATIMQEFFSSLSI